MFSKSTTSYVLRCMKQYSIRHGWLFLIYIVYSLRFSEDLNKRPRGLDALLEDLKNTCNQIQSQISNLIYTHTESSGNQCQWVRCCFSLSIIIIFYIFITFPNPHPRQLIWIFIVLWILLNYMDKPNLYSKRPLSWSPYLSRTVATLERWRLVRRRSNKVIIFTCITNGQKSGHIREGDLSWEWPLREGLLYIHYPFYNMTNHFHGQEVGFVVIYR